MLYLHLSSIYSRQHQCTCCHNAFLTFSDQKVSIEMGGDGPQWCLARQETKSAEAAAQKGINGCEELRTSNRQRTFGGRKGDFTSFENTTFVFQCSREKTLLKMSASRKNLHSHCPSLCFTAVLLTQNVQR